jgi:hypothetical protein
VRAVDARCPRRSRRQRWPRGPGLSVALGTVRPLESLDGGTVAAHGRGPAARALGHLHRRPTAPVARVAAGAGGEQRLDGEGAWPVLAARWSGVSPWDSARCGEAPAANNACTEGALGLRHARCSAVSPFWPVASAGAPASSSALTALACPSRPATLSGVHPAHHRTASSHSRRRDPSSSTQHGSERRAATRARSAAPRAATVPGGRRGGARAMPTATGPRAPQPRGMRSIDGRARHAKPT